jgi:Amt family ammonium transporter
MIMEWMLKGKPSVLGVISGAVAGLVAITPASGFVDPVGALAIGLAAGVFCYFGATSIKHMFGYDDSLDAFGVHGIGGIVGAILTGVFARASIMTGSSSAPDMTKGGLIDGHAGQVVTQLIGIGATAGYCAIGTLIILWVINLTVGLRVDQDSEREGLDITQHGEVLG